jgi:hypothetical protein
MYLPQMAKQITRMRRMGRSAALQSTAAFSVTGATTICPLTRFLVCLLLNEINAGMMVLKMTSQSVSHIFGGGRCNDILAVVPAAWYSNWGRRLKRKYGMTNDARTCTIPRRNLRLRLKILRIEGVTVLRLANVSRCVEKGVDREFNTRNGTSRSLGYLSAYSQSHRARTRE